VISKLKYTSLFVIMSIALLVFVGQPNITEAKSFETKAKTAILVDADSGKILYAKDENEALPPASMTKMMTEYLVLEQIDKGEIDWDSKVQIGDYPYELSGNDDFSGVGLRQNVDYTVEQLYEAMAINSDNATTAALAEFIADSEGEFVKMMNDKAEELGMTESKFVNASGLDNESLDGNHPEGTEADDTNLMSAKDAAILAYNLITDYPESLEISSIPSTDFDGQEIRNWNYMLKHDTDYLKDFYYEGLDGLKTGNTDLAGFTFTGTAERDGHRLISVVMKTDSVEERFKETAKLLDYGFDEFGEKELFPAGYDEFEGNTLPVDKGKEDNVSLELADDLTMTTEEGTEDKYNIQVNVDESLLNDDGELSAPIKKGTKIGTVELTMEDGEDFGYIFDNDDEQGAAEIVASEDVDKKNWFSLMLGAIGQFFTNLYDKFMGLF